MPSAAPAPRAAMVLVLLTLGAWLVGLRGDFQYDDWPNIVLDPATSSAAALRERLLGGFRPLLRASYALDYRLWGFHPAGFLLTGLLLHAATVVAVWKLARLRWPNPGAAFAAAAVFSLQPAHAAVVASASGRSTGLSTLLMILALLAHERAHGGSSDGKRAAPSDARWLACMLALFALATAAKEVALVLPALLLLWEATRTPMEQPAQIARRLAPACLAAAILAALWVAFSPRLREITSFSLALANPADAMAQHAAALPYSLTLWFRPWALAIEHPAPASSAAIPGALALFAIVWLALAVRHRAPVVTMALLWPLVVCLPTHSIFARLDPVVEKALYAAWIGPSLGVGALFGLAMARARTSRSRTREHALRAGAIAALAMLAACCWWRADRWADPPMLWREATERAPLSARAWHNRALAEFAAGRMEEAEASIGQALALDADSSRHHDTARAISLFMPPSAQVAAPRVQPLLERTAP